MSSPRISVIVPSYNSGNQLCTCLRSIYSHAADHDLEIVVVDDGSTDGSVAEAGEAFPSLVIVRADRLGCDGARQAGIDAATGDIIANTDADCVVASTWLDGILSALDSGAAAVTGPVIHQTDLLSTIVAVADFPDFQSLRSDTIRNFPGCNFALRRGTLDRYGYRSRNEITCGTDRLLAWRLTSNGGRIVYNSQMQVHHQPAISAWGLLSRRRRYAVTAMCVRKLDPTLPGGRLSRLGRLAAPAYCGARMAKDLRLVTRLAMQRRIGLWQVPAALVWSPLLRGLDMAFMLHGSFSEVTTPHLTPGSASELVTSD